MILILCQAKAQQQDQTEFAFGLLDVKRKIRWERNCVKKG